MKGQAQRTAAGIGAEIIERVDGPFRSGKGWIREVVKHVAISGL